MSASGQGAIAATSRGTVMITASVAGQARLGGLGEEADGEAGACLWSNSATRGYELVATGSGSGGAFTDDAGDRYSVGWSAAAAPLAPGRATALLTADADHPACAAAIGGPRLAINGARGGGTLTLMVEPE